MPWGSAAREADWRRSIADAVRRARGDLVLPIDAQIAVEAKLFLLRSRIRRVDLDNLAKPLLDTLFRPLYPQVKELVLAGALSDQDDGCVSSLLLTKEEVVGDSTEGMELTVSWTEVNLS